MSVEERLPAYRADIDGLRAVAVAAVILFHAEVPGVPGGFVGVDVFFVISGFLITGWLRSREALALPALLKEFYARRGRRILPAFVVMLAVTTVVALQLLQPAHLEIYGKFLATSAVMLANVGARFNGNYFGWSASDMPLLHLWSIAVEEQFYLLYPLVLFVIARYAPRRRAAILASGALASFMLCVWAADTHPVANYFYLPTRAWELLLGALVALDLWPHLVRPVAREIVAAISLAAIVAACALYDASLTYPGPFALVPCVATALLISIGRDGGSAINRLLAARPLVFTGLLSYSLYLWHMPVLGLFRYYNIFAPTPAQIVVACGAIYLLSFGTWALVEQPFRTRRRLPRDAQFWAAAAAASACLLGVGVTMQQMNDLPRRLAEAAAAAPGTDVGMRQRAARCMGVDLPAIRRGALCRFGPASDPAARVVVWGDSHTWALVPIYKDLAERRHVQIFVAQSSSCSPLIGAVRDPICASFNDAMVDAVRVIDPALVVLGSYWSNPKMRLAATSELTVRSDESLFSRGLQETVRRVGAAQRRICVIKTVPSIAYQGEYALAMARFRGIDSSFLAIPREAAYAQQRSFDTAIDSLEKRGLLMSVDPKRVLCREKNCRYLSDGGASLYMDDNHVSMAGAQLLHDEVERCFSAIGRS